MERVKKTVTINLRVTPELKGLLAKQAREQNRSITSYLEWLVLQAAQATGQSARTEPKKRRG